MLFVLCYHSIDASGSLVSVTPAAFERQMAVLERSGAAVLPLTEAVAAILARGGRARGGQGKPLVAITFDDGYRSVLENALPILLRHGFPATVFIVSNFVGQQATWAEKEFPICSGRDWTEIDSERRAVMRRELAEKIPVLGRVRDDVLDRFVTGMREMSKLELATWAENAELVRSGVELGAHGADHRFMSRLDDDAIRDEIALSCATIEQQLSVRVASFCYPYGDFDARVVTAVREAGLIGCTTQPGSNGPANFDAAALRRVSVDSGTGPVAFRARLSPLYGRFRALVESVRRRR